MRTTFAFAVISTLVLSTCSSVAADVQICTIDAFYKGLWHNTEIDYDATTFCRSLLSSPTVISCVATSTSRVTEMPSANITDTVTSVTNVPTSTMTLTSTAMAFDVATTSTGTSAKARYGRRLIADVTERQLPSTTHSSVDLTASLVSACTCNAALSAETQSIICTVNSTIINSVITRTTSTEYLTVSSGTTTVTATVYTTTSIPITGNSTSTSSQTSWTVSVSSTSVTSTSTSTPTVQPSGCPSINGTRLNGDAQDCTYYERICYLSYADNDFYNVAYRFDTPEQCAALCDAQNRGDATPCLGIVWNTDTTSGANCRQLKSVDSPQNATGSIAILLMHDENCPVNSSSTTTVTTSTWSPSNSVPVTTSASTTTTTTNTNRTVDPTLISSTTVTTVSSNGPPVTTSALTNATWSYITMNTSSSTGCAPSTVYATMYSTVTVSAQGWNNSWKSWHKTGSGSVTLTSTVNDTSTVTVTSTISNNSSMTVTQTETITNSYTTTKTETESSTVTVTISSLITDTVTTCPTSSSSSVGPTITGSSSSTTDTPTTSDWSSTTTTAEKHRGHWWAGQYQAA